MLLQATIEKILLFSSDHETYQSLEADEESFDAILMNFVTVGELVHKLSDECKNHYSHINWTQIKDLRNVIAHDYFSVEAEAIWQIIHNHLISFQIEVEKIIEKG